MKPASLLTIELRIPRRIIIFVTMMIAGQFLSPYTQTGYCRADNTTTVSKTPTEIEYDVKAAFIYNFMKFIEWPADKKEDPTSPMMIGILGNNPFGQSFQPLLDKTIRGRAIQLVEIPSYQTFLDKSHNKQGDFNAYRKKYTHMFQQCDILFICQSEKDVFNSLLPLAQNQSILTVSDITGFSETGGMIGFVTEKKKIRFEINLSVVTQEQIKIRSQLLGLARKIYKDTP